MAVTPSPPPSTLAASIGDCLLWKCSAPLSRPVAIASYHRRGQRTGGITYSTARRETWPTVCFCLPPIQMNYTENESRPPQWEAGEKPLQVWHSYCICTNKDESSDLCGKFGQHYYYYYYFHNFKHNSHTKTFTNKVRSSKILFINTNWFMSFKQIIASHCQYTNTVREKFRLELLKYYTHQV